MPEKSHTQDRIRAYIRRLENPYASLEVQRADEESVNDERRAYIRRLENPYAVLQVEGADEQAKQRKAQFPVAAAADGTGKLSKADFDAQCRAIFRSYLPELERKGPLRVHHRHFITRNAARPPEERFRLVQFLKKYDLSDVVGLRSQFNREEDHFTEAKLKEIERLLDSGE